MVKSALISFAFLISAASITAQSANNTIDDRCQNNIQYLGLNGTVNSTGVVSIPWGDEGLVKDWSLTMTFNESTKHLNETFRPLAIVGYLQGYLNVPQYPFKATNDPQSTHACVYMLGGRNVTYSGRPGNSCEGIFTNECMKLLTTNMTMSNTYCPAIPTTRLSLVEEVCGDIWSNESAKMTAEPVHISTPNCSLPLPQGAFRGSGIERTFAAMGLAKLGDEQGQSDHSYYDRIVRQVVPWIISVHVGGSSRTQMVCVAPDNIVGDSRVPQGQWPPAGATQTLHAAPSGTSSGTPSVTPSGAGKRIGWTSIHFVIIAVVLLLNAW